ncbi:uncharacterized protein [Ptychodera flava]|uniref:uncharacterized protein n=1 Tax=Ptychodera flava TaxID=63121 RepID=UPI00396A25E1
MDEAGIKVTTGQPLYGHSLIGTPCVEVCRYMKSPMYTLQLLVGYDGVKHYRVIEGGSDTNEYVHFIHEAVQSFGEDGQRALQQGDILISDNAPIHRNEGELILSDWLDTLGIEYSFTPTYSPI